MIIYTSDTKNMINTEHVYSFYIDGTKLKAILSNGEIFTVEEYECEEHVKMAFNEIFSSFKMNKQVCTLECVNHYIKFMDCKKKAEDKRKRGE